MTDEQFDNLVHRLDESASRDPAGYRRRVVALAFLGYAYLGFILAVLGVLFLLALASLAVLKAFGIKLVVALGAFIAVVLKAMWVRLAPPAGREMTRAEAPALFDEVEALRRRLEAPPFHRILPGSRRRRCAPRLSKRRGLRRNLRSLRAASRSVAA